MLRLRLWKLGQSLKRLGIQLAWSLALALALYGLWSLAWDLWRATRGGEGAEAGSSGWRLFGPEEPSGPEELVEVEHLEDGRVLLRPRSGGVAHVGQGPVVFTYGPDGSVTVRWEGEASGTSSRRAEPPAVSRFPDDTAPDDTLPPEAAAPGASPSEPPAAERPGQGPVGPVTVSPPGSSTRPPEATGREGGQGMAPDLVVLRRRNLLVPVQGIEPRDLQDTFDDPRSGGRTHFALDIMAPRGTPVLATEAGVVSRLADNDLGGLTLFQRGSEGRYVYYYAHLDRYAPGLTEGERVSKGQILGYVGSTGNAPESAPHLHFAIHRATSERRWWRGEPINPYRVFVAD